MKRIILMISVVIVGLIFYSLFQSDNINSLEGDFEELAFERNENNTGPIHRVYVFSVEDTVWSEMKKHSDLLPHTKYGTTEVYYFLKEKISKSQLKLSLNGINQEAKSNCIAHSVKDGQSRINFKKYPF
ncbi:hypothetical protein QYS49_31310 [Marivirga salinae]|uniref:Uncharacterized protein n=1 Tax=Marivirga salinarum TaxID=3059078 RepID=A0AA49GBR0_9BACT|nr:hypothetical protein [Marivirga sp. BDSF4-3]WKK75850.1 hypothetical protein QYS49_31310 [Marivirga sp. BDSF4-3]